MFVVGVVKSPSSTFEHVAKPALDRFQELDTQILTVQGAGSIAKAYNDILDRCNENFPDAEGLVLLHQDVEITDAEFFPRLRADLRDPSVGLVGILGATGVRSLVYWRADVRGFVRERHRTLDFGRGRHEVDAVDGMLLALAPQVFKRLRFDDDLCRGFHGYDIDFSFTVRAAGLRVLVDDLPVIHHTKGGYGDRQAYLRSCRAWRRKWMSTAPLTTRILSWHDELQVASRRDVVRLKGRLSALRRSSAPT